MNRLSRMSQVLMQNYLTCGKCEILFFILHIRMKALKGTPCCSLTKTKSANEQFPQESSRYAQAAAILKFDDVLSKL